MTASEIKQVKALAQKKYRDESGLFVVEGEKMVAEALKSGFEVEKICRIEEIGREAMSRITQLSSPSPVLAVLRQRFSSQKGKIAPGLYLALDAIRDPGNLGTIIRIADWFGIDGIIASPDTVDLYNPKVVQATMGAIFRVKFQYRDLTEFLPEVLACDGDVYGTFLDGGNIYESQISTGADSPVVIVIGNESNGISDAVGELVTDTLFIPPYPDGVRSSESLNAAVATAITVAEFRRRLHTSSL